MDSPESLYYFSSKYLTYREFFAIQNFIRLLPTLGVLGLISIILNIVANKYWKSSADSNKDKKRSKNAFHVLAGTSSLAFFGIIALYFSVLHGFRIIPIEWCYTGAVITFSIFGSLHLKTLLQSKVLLILSLIGILSVVFLGPIVFGGMCQAYQFFTNGTWDYLITTSLSRQLTLPEACPIGRPCHLYATLPEDTSDSVFINFHTNIIYNESKVCYSLPQTKGPETCFTAKTVSLKSLEKPGQRNVHSAYLYNMLPDTLYDIKIYYENTLQAEDKYRTLPLNTTTRNLTIVMGGDAGFMELAYETGRTAAQYKPDLIVLGGDIAYDNGMDTCYYTWDQFFGVFDYMNKVKGSIIPFIFSIGNHDAGVEALSIRTVELDEQGPPYFTFFPQHSKTGANGEIIKEVPEIKDRKSYNYHIVGGSLHLNLDSGYISGYAGPQLEWMRALSRKYSAMPKFASYHVPIFWVTGLWDPVASGMVQGMQYWVPEFDRNQYMSIWENHSHLLKRTKPLKGGVPAENGTIYLGEGCWGALCYGLPLENSTGIFDGFASGKNHFWVAEYGKKGISYTAIDMKNEIIDKVEQRYESYGLKL